MSSLTPRIDRLDRNGAINGNFDFWQRRTFVNGTGLSADAYITADRVKISWNWAGAGHNLDWARSTDVPTYSQSGFRSLYSYSFTSNASKTFPASLDYFQPFIYKMEGHDFQRFYGKDVTFSFWFKASVVGTYNFSLQNPSASRTYVSEFTVSAANTWQFVTKTINMEVVTWNLDNTAALNIYIGQLANSALTTSTLNTWGALSGIVSTGATNYLTTVGATFKIAQFSIVETSAFSDKGFCRAGRTIAEELQLCQRYYEKSYDIETPPGTNTSLGMIEIIARNARSANQAGTFTGFTTSFKVSKRAIPAVAYYAQGGTINAIFNGSSGAIPAGIVGFGAIGTNTVFQLTFDTSSNQPWSLDHALRWHYTADAEL